MFVELIATFVAGLAGAGAVMLVNRVLGGRLPRWATPVVAGMAMLTVIISNEYSWFSRTRDALPEDVVIAQTIESKAFYRPWTYVWPFVERFVAVDMATVRSHPQQPGVKLAEVYFFGRWSPVSKVPVLTDCPGLKRAALTDGISFESDGVVSGVEWVAVPSGDPVVSTICGGG
ncbi:MAG: hypothetical protein K5905_08040 [Roseibium sp.]|uniref:hypothetical protein n=1 Tax=Roseibium sp. TaxID=1936156 RepID=UPI00261D8593|nr:hypothetical protein [Roseibium sp.]MCV0425409.1 hypothetical protein [Roseibium sp.]